MLITLEKLQEAKACSVGVEWFKTHYPNGTTLKELALDPEIPKQFLHWGYQNLESGEIERSIFWEKMNIKCAEPMTIILSENIFDSRKVNKSKDVQSSQYIFSSKAITNSTLIQSSKEIQNSSLVFSSKKVTNSEKVYKSTNITNSKEVLCSNEVDKSFGVLYGENINNSIGILGKKDLLSCFVSNSYFIGNSAQVDKSLFCYGLQDRCLCLFNKEITEEQYIRYKEELLKLLKGFNFEFLANVPSIENFPAIPMLEETNNYFKRLPIEFLEWVKTLPGYDETILFNILKNK